MALLEGRRGGAAGSDGVGQSVRRVLSDRLAGGEEELPRGKPPGVNDTLSSFSEVDIDTVLLFFIVVVVTVTFQQPVQVSAP